MTGQKPPGTEVKVICFARQKGKKMTLEAFDRLQRESDRAAQEKRAEVERIARKRI